MTLARFAESRAHRFVENDEQGIGDEPTRDRDPLPLITGNFTGKSGKDADVESNCRQTNSNPLTDYVTTEYARNFERLGKRVCKT